MKRLPCRQLMEVVMAAMLHMTILSIKGSQGPIRWPKALIIVVSNKETRNKNIGVGGIVERRYDGR